MTHNFFQINKYLTQCDPKDIISFGSENWFSISKFEETIDQSFSQNGINSIINNISNNLSIPNSTYLKNLFYEGKDCEILRAGSQGWQKGKIKIKINVTLEFIPDELEEIESPLDDIRANTIQNSNSN